MVNYDDILFRLPSEWSLTGKVEYIYLNDMYSFVKIDCISDFLNYHCLK